MGYRNNLKGTLSFKFAELNSPMQKGYETTFRKLMEDEVEFEELKGRLYQTQGQNNCHD